MSKVYKLADLARSIGLDLIRFEFVHPSLTNVHAVYHQYSKAGAVPIEEHCRDECDYELLVNAWKKRGETYSPLYDNFDSMLSGELKRLKHGG